MYLPSMEICGVGRSSEISEMRRLSSVFGTYAYAIAMSLTPAPPGRALYFTRARGPLVVLQACFMERTRGGKAELKTDSRVHSALDTQAVLPAIVGKPRVAQSQRFCVLYSTHSTAADIKLYPACHDKRTAAPASSRTSRPWTTTQSRLFARTRNPACQAGKTTSPPTWTSPGPTSSCS